MFQPEQSTAPSLVIKTRLTSRTFQLADLISPSGLNGNLLLLRRKEVLFRKDTAADAAFYVQEGRIKMRIASPQGRMATVALMGPGDFLGEECLGPGQAARTSTAVAISTCTVVRLEREFIEQKLHNDPEFLDYFMGFILARNRRYQEDLMSHLCYTGEKRLARALFILSGLAASKRDEEVVERINQDEVAEWIGTTRARVSFFMNRFREKGFIDYNGELTVRRSLLEVIDGR
jgi:CRP-like cAMP-binding protein